jgi:hydrogenase nickel insertion protein HypA
MHEFALAQSIISAVNKNTGDDFKKMIAIHVEVGEFAGVVSDSLEFGLEITLKDQGFENVKIQVSTVPALAICECTHEYFIKDIFETCPQCHSLKRTMNSGTDVIIKSVEIAD